MTSSPPRLIQHGDKGLQIQEKFVEIWICYSSVKVASLILAAMKPVILFFVVETAISVFLSCFSRIIDTFEKISLTLVGNSCFCMSSVCFRCLVTFYDNINKMFF